MFTNVVVINLVIALVLEQFRLRDHRKLAIQRREVLKAVRTTQVRWGSVLAHELPTYLACMPFFWDLCYAEHAIQICRKPRKSEKRG